MLFGKLHVGVWIFVEGKVLGAGDEGLPAAEQLFDPDPAHPWNQLHRVFYVREMAKGRTYFHDGPDAPFGREGPFLVEGGSHAKAIETLDAFLKAKDDERIQDSLKRALLQRDLWHVFDKLAERSVLAPDDPIKDKQAQRRAVQKRLAQVMRRLEQPAAQLRALPDNYAVAIKSGTFPAKFNPKRPEQPYLPEDLRLDGTGDWVLISRWYPQSTGLAAPRHADFVAGKAVVVSLLRLPGGRKPTEDFVARLPHRRDDGKQDELPELPNGSQVALVRRMLLVDDRGTLQATPVTEDVQIRIFPKGKEQRFFEFILDRAGLLSGHGGLRAIGPDEADYFGFGAGHDQFDPFSEEKPRPERPALSRCIGCHNAEKLWAVNTFGFGLTVGYQGGLTTDFAAQVGHTVKLKEKSYSWGLLHGLRETTPP